MIINFSKLFATIATFIIFMIVSVIFIFSIIKDKTNKNLDLKSDKILTKATIYENNYGIGHIIAESDEDLFFAIGYYQAEKRLWQLDFLRRFATGELSEIFGKESIEIDKFMRSFEIRNVAYKNWDSLSGKSQSILKSFSDGINYYLETHKNNLPVEFALLEYSPNKWEPWHSLAISKAMTFEFSFGIWVDIVNGQIKNKLGEKYLKYFIPNFYDYKFNNVFEKEEIIIDSSYINTLSKISNKFNLFQSGIGSNCWTTGATQSQGNDLILANDPHTAIGVPARWIQVHISNDNINTVGLMIPGIPLPIIGRNDNISWGITSLLIDDFDYHIEKLSKDKKYYYVNDTVKKEIEYQADTIKIKNSEPILYYQMKTDMSAIISDSHLSKNLKSFAEGEYYQSKNYFDNNVLTFQWVGNQVSDEILSMYKVNRSQDFEEFESAFSTWKSPGLSFHYIGKDNINKIVPAGIVPIREEGHNPLLPQISYKKRFKWIGYESLYKSSQVDDRNGNGYLISANHLFVKSNNYVTNYQEPDSRFKRIDEVLALEKPNNIARTKYLQIDQKSIYAKELLQNCLPIIDAKQNLLNNLEIKAFNKLKSWDNILSSRSVSSSIYTLFFFNLLKNTYSDELGKSLMAQYTFLSSISTRKLIESIVKKEDKIFDNINTKEIENRDYIIFISYRAAIEDAKKIFQNSDINRWKYGEIHKIQPNHILSKMEELKPVFEFGEYPIGGNNTTILNTNWNYNDKFKASVYPSVRFVSNLRDSLIYMSLPGGTSGNPQSVNYKDQFQLWLNGGYIPIPLSRNVNSNFKEKIIIRNAN